MLDLLLDAIWPRRAADGTIGCWISQRERAALGTRPLCLEGEKLRELGIEGVERLVALGAYHSPLLRRAILRLKYGRARSLVPELGSALAEASRLLSVDVPPVLCPVPLHWTRAWERGFNQAFLLAEHVGYVCGWEAEELLVRSRPTGRQARRTTGDRRRALREAFTVRSPIVAPPHVILLDDVATSGATLTACAQALRDAGAQRVQALVVAVG